MQPSRQGASRRHLPGWLLWLWVLGAGLAGAGAGLAVLVFEDAHLNDTPSAPQAIFVFMQAAIILGVLAGALSPTAWRGNRGTAALAALLAGIVLFVFVSVRVVDAGNASGFFFGCLTLPFLLVSVLAGFFGSWIGALVADIGRGGEE